jgi:hypothetical protein
MFDLNDQFIQLQVEKRVDRFDLIKTDVDKVIRALNDDNLKDWSKISYTEKEILDLASMPDIPYKLINNSWIRTDLVGNME